VRENHSAVPPSLSSILTIRPSPNPESVPPAARSHGAEPSEASIASVESYSTASSQIAPSVAAATEGGSTIRMSPSTLMHRFTLIKPGAKRNSPYGGGSGPASPPAHHHAAGAVDGWSPFDFFFSSGMLAAKCDLCAKRVGWKPVLECDDCGLR
jgi:LIM domain kinase 1